jgi:hypothetical protein
MKHIVEHGPFYSDYSNSAKLALHWGTCHSPHYHGNLASACGQACACARATCSTHRFSPRSVAQVCIPFPCTSLSYIIIRSRSARKPWCPSFSLAVRILLLVRISGAMYSNIQDCDEGEEYRIRPDNYLNQYRSY